MAHWTHALISGGGSGLGHGIAMRLLHAGSSVSVLDLGIDDARRASLDAAAQNGGSRWQFFPADVRDEAVMRSAVEAAVATHGAPDVAINSAGIIANQTFDEMAPATFRRIIDVNLVGSCHFAAAVLPTMHAGSRLALIASLAGLTSNYGYAAYGASKFGVVGLATTLRYEYAPRGIAVSCICPPEVRTPMVETEHRIGNPVSLELKKFAGSLDADVACDAIVAGLARGTWMIIPGGRAKFTALAARLMPGLFHAISQRLLQRALRRHGMWPQ